MLQMDGPEWMLVSILSVLVDFRKVSWTQAALALACLCGELKPEDLLSPFFLMLVIKNLNLS